MSAQWNSNSSGPKPLKPPYAESGEVQWTAAALKEAGGDPKKVVYLIPPGTSIPPQVSKFLDEVGVLVLDIIPHK